MHLLTVLPMPPKEATVHVSPFSSLRCPSAPEASDLIILGVRRTCPTDDDGRLGGFVERSRDESISPNAMDSSTEAETNPLAWDATAQTCLHSSQAIYYAAKNSRGLVRERVAFERILEE